jgi:diketogulonate reductase-like aldo/keto reductase
MSAATSPTLELNNGVTMPALGFGVFQTPPEETAASVEAALRDGYRLIDTAAAYGRRSGIARDDAFLETKVWISDYGYDATLHAFDKAPASLGSNSSTCCCCISRCRVASISRSMPTGHSKSCSPTARCALSG